MSCFDIVHFRRDTVHHAARVNSYVKEGFDDDRHVFIYV